MEGQTEGTLRGEEWENMIGTKIQRELIENNYMTLILSNVEGNLKDLNNESWVLNREGLSEECVND
jgi:hypothetical protein